MILLPTVKWTVYEADGKKMFSIWRQWLNFVYDVQKFEI